MHKNIILVDNENIHLSSVPSLLGEKNELWIFHGSNQTTVPFNIVKTLQPFGQQVEYVRISGNGKNALDFHIAFMIGRLSQKDPEAVFYIVSKDKGFDPLLEYLKQENIPAKRYECLEEIPFLKSRDANTPQQRADIIEEQLRTGSKPNKEKNLSNAINARFAKKLTEPEVKAVIKELEKRKFLNLTDGKVTYTLDTNDSYPF